MKMNSASIIGACLGIALLLQPQGAVQAEEEDSRPFEAFAALDLKAVSVEELADTSGREGMNPVNLAILNSQATGNSVGDNTVTGAVNFDDNAFQNFDGFAVINANSGPNSSFNANMSVNIIITTGAPAP